MSNFVSCSYRAPISQQRGPWNSPRQNPGENTALTLYLVPHVKLITKLFYYRTVNIPVKVKENQALWPIEIEAAKVIIPVKFCACA